VAHLSLVLPHHALAELGLACSQVSPFGITPSAGIALSLELGDSDIGKGMDEDFGSFVLKWGFGTKSTSSSFPTIFPKFKDPNYFLFPYTKIHHNRFP
jgi:hypothetical protein